jgi:prepilin peptidase CpaA
MRALTEIGHNAAFLLLLPFLAVAVTTDLSRRQIPNLLIVYMLGCGGVVQAVLFGSSGALQALSGLMVGLVLLLPFYASGGMGAGDVKLLAAAGTFLGPQGALLAGALTLGAGGLLALFLLAWCALVRVVNGRLSIARTGLAPPAATRLELPYSVAIAVGTLIAAYTMPVEPLRPWGLP